MASNFIETYYPALKSNRDDIASYYAQVTTTDDGQSIPVIIYNGNTIQDPSAMQAMFKDQMTGCHYEVEDYDCHILNPNYVPQGVEGAKPETGKNMMILLSVSGSFTYGDLKTTLDASRTFSDSIILVPNPGAVTNFQKLPLKEWLIQSQTFRLVA